MWVANAKGVKHLNTVLSIKIQILNNYMKTKRWPGNTDCPTKSQKRKFSPFGSSIVFLKLDGVASFVADSPRGNFNIRLNPGNLNILVNFESNMLFNNYFGFKIS